MKVNLYKFLIARNNGDMGGLRDLITKFSEQLRYTDQIIMKGEDGYSYYLQDPIIENELILLHYIESSEMKGDNIRKEETKNILSYMNKDELADLRDIKHIFIIIDIKKEILYMNHAFRTIDKAKLFLSNNSEVFKDNLKLVEPINIEALADLIEYVNSIEYKSVPQDMMMNMISDGIVIDMLREPEVKSTSFKVTYRDKSKPFGGFLSNQLKSAVDNNSEIIFKYTGKDKIKGIINTKKMMYYYYIGNLSLKDEKEEATARRTIYDFIEGLS